MKKALITRILELQCSYLVEFLLNKYYEVSGILNHSSSFNAEHIEHLYIDNYIRDMHNAKNFFLHYEEIIDSINVSPLKKPLPQ